MCDKLNLEKLILSGGFMLEIGLKNEVSEVVTKEKTAIYLGSGELEVYGTPAMIALMEKASYTCVLNYLEDGFGSVGTSMNVKHLSSTPVGMEVKARCELIEIEGRKLVFKVEAYDKVGKIGEGVHERFVVENLKFQEKTNNKK